MILSGFGYMLRNAYAYGAQHQIDVLNIMTVLPGAHRYEAVEAALEAALEAAVTAKQVYTALCTGEQTEVLARFYEALGEE